MKQIAILLSTLYLLAYGCKKDEKITPSNSNTVVDIDTVEQKEYLVIKISNIKEIKGNMQIALVDNQEDFQNSKNAVRTAIVPVNSGKLEVRIDNILPGKNYALTIYHDANSNGILDKNVFGIPREGFCFSNNAMGSFGPPSYDECKFEIKAATAVVQDLQLRYF